MIHDDGYNIESDGVYIPARGFTGTVNAHLQKIFPSEVKKLGRIFYFSNDAIKFFGTAGKFLQSVENFLKYFWESEICG